MDMESTKTTKEVEVYLKNHDDKIIEYNHILLQPVTQRNRFRKAFYANKIKAGYKEKEVHPLYLDFLLENYIKNNDNLIEGKFPNQNYLVNFLILLSISQKTTQMIIKIF